MTKSLSHCQPNTLGGSNPCFFRWRTAAAADLKPGTLARGFGAWWVSSDGFDFVKNFTSRYSFHQISWISMSWRLHSFSQCIPKNKLNLWKNRFATVAPWVALAILVILPSISSSASVLWFLQFSSLVANSKTMWHHACLGMNQTTRMLEVIFQSKLYPSAIMAQIHWSIRSTCSTNEGYAITKHPINYPPKNTANMGNIEPENQPLWWWLFIINGYTR